MDIPPLPPSGASPLGGSKGSPYGPEFDAKLKELETTFLYLPSKDGWTALQNFLKEHLSQFPKSSPEATQALNIINHPFSYDTSWAREEFNKLNDALGISF